MMFPDTSANDYVFDNRVIDTGPDGSGTAIFVRGNNHVFFNNHIEDTRKGSDRTQDIGIDIKTAASNTIVLGNYLNNHITANLVDKGSNSIILRNVGYQDTSQKLE